MNICTANLSTLLFIDTASSSLKLDNHKMQETALSIADYYNGSNHHSDQVQFSSSNLRAYVAAEPILKDQEQRGETRNSPLLKFDYFMNCHVSNEQNESKCPVQTL